MKSSGLIWTGLLAEKAANRALEQPGKNAVFARDSQYSYGTLFGSVGRVFRRLVSCPEQNCVGIWCNDDLHTYAAILAVNLIGAAYVPLNPKFPEERNRAIISRCGIRTIISSEEREVLHAFSMDCDLLFTGTEVENSSPEDIKSLLLEAEKLRHARKNKNEICYVLFTSGSTGEPKGIPVTHDNVNAFFQGFCSQFEFDEEDRFLQSSELTFDFSVFAFFMPLCIGANCYIVPDTRVKFIRILEMLQQHKITVLSMVPTILMFIEKYLREVRLPFLRLSFFSGDALYHDLAVKWKTTAPATRILNCYGTTETTVVCTAYEFEEERSALESVNGIVPIGKPLPGMAVLIVDERGEVAEKGEMCFAGAQVIRDYLNGSAEKKFFEYEGKRFYKPGDLGAYNGNADLVFLGRTDNQVKINGYRVELVEIEHAIEKVSGKKCAVLCIKDDQKMNKLLAFIETRELENDLREKLMKHLPAYMLPHKFIAVEHFDLTLNGKIDRNKLTVLH